MRISDWSSDVCSSDLAHLALFDRDDVYNSTSLDGDVATHTANRTATPAATKRFRTNLETVIARYGPDKVSRTGEHTYELQSLMRTSYAFFCLQNKIDDPKMTKAMIDHATHH